MVCTDGHPKVRQLFHEQWTTSMPGGTGTGDPCQCDMHGTHFIEQRSIGILTYPTNPLGFIFLVIVHGQCILGIQQTDGKN